MGVRRNREILLNGYRVYLRDDENFWKQIVVMIAQLYKCIKSHWIIYLKCLTCQIYVVCICHNVLKF